MTNKSEPIRPTGNIDVLNAAGQGEMRGSAMEASEEIKIEEEIIIEEDIARNPNIIKQLAAPLTEEWINHQLTHTPFRAWCPICVQAKAKSLPHRKSRSNDRGFPVIGLDYMFMTPKPSGEHLVYPILVIKDSKSGGIWTIPTSRKGITGFNVVARITEIIVKLGYPKVMLKSDQEVSMKDIQKEVRKELWSEMMILQKKIKENREGNSSGSSSDSIINSGFGGEIILENSPVGESQAIGMVEKAIQYVQGYIRAKNSSWKNGLDARS